MGKASQVSLYLSFPTILPHRTMDQMCHTLFHASAFGSVPKGWFPKFLPLPKEGRF